MPAKLYYDRTEVWEMRDDQIFGYFLREIVFLPLFYLCRHLLFIYGFVNGSGSPKIFSERVAGPYRRIFQNLGPASANRKEDWEKSFGLNQAVLERKLFRLFVICNWDLFNFNRGFFWFFLFMYGIQHCFIFRPSDSTVSEDAGIEPRTIVTPALAVRRNNHSTKSHPHRLNFIHKQLGTYRPVKNFITIHIDGYVLFEA